MDGIHVLYFYCTFSEHQARGAKPFSEVKHRKRETKEGHIWSAMATCQGLNFWQWPLELLRLLAVYFEDLIVKTLNHLYIALNFLSNMEMFSLKLPKSFWNLVMLFFPTFLFGGGGRGGARGIPTYPTTHFVKACILSLDQKQHFSSFMYWHSGV